MRDASYALINKLSLWHGLAHQLIQSGNYKRHLPAEGSPPAPASKQDKTAHIARLVGAADVCHWWIIHRNAGCFAGLINKLSLWHGLAHQLIQSGNCFRHLPADGSPLAPAGKPDQTAHIARLVGAADVYHWWKIHRNAGCFAGPISKIFSATWVGASTDPKRQ